MINAPIFGGMVLIFSALTLTRYILAFIEIEQQRKASSPTIDEGTITVLQPILGGDPTLAYCLMSNLNNASEAHFIWLLDADDTEGQRSAQKALHASGRQDVQLIVSPPPPTGINPKTYKLACGLQKTETTFVAVLDDDTVLPKGTLGRAAAWAAQGTLVTGLPAYNGQQNWGSRLVCGFVNANSILTYLPASQMNLTRTINGMFSLMRREDILNYGGFSSFVKEVTDDYALARLFLCHGGRIKQTSLPLFITTTTENARHYFTLMRRWMVFAKLYLRENFSLGIFGMVLLPGILPLPMLLAGLMTGYGATLLVFCLLGIKSMLVRSLARRLNIPGAPFSDTRFQIAAELLLPLHIITASLNPHHVQWRKRSFTLKGRDIIDG